MQALDFWSGPINTSLVERLVESMSSVELAGQVLLYGYPGETPNERTLGWIRDSNLGGVKIFGWNANTLEALTSAINTMQRTSQLGRLRIPLFVATDQEGGWVRHVRFNTSMTSGNMSIGATRLPFDSYRTGHLIGMELKALGINFNFAPSVDIATNPEAHVIGSRSFSEDPIQTAILGVAFYKGMEEAGIIATAKHFPGHGHASEDSHGKLPRVLIDLETMNTRELVPYQYLIRENIPAIMSGHLAFPQITGNDEPASLNSFFAQEILRNRLGFKNILITDDLFMEGARPKGKTLPEIAEIALRSGHDLILISQPQDALAGIVTRFTRLADSDAAFRTRLKESVTRILTIKLRYMRGPHAVPLYPSLATAQSLIPANGSKDFFFQQAIRSVSILRGQRIPWPSSPGRVLLITPYPRFLGLLARRVKNAEILEYSYDPFYGYDAGVRDAIRSRAAGYDKILFNLVTPGSLELLRALEPFKEKVTVISQLSPILIRKVAWLDSALAVWGLGLDNLEAGISALMGDFIPTARAPLVLTP